MKNIIILGVFGAAVILLGMREDLNPQAFTRLAGDRVHVITHVNQAVAVGAAQSGAYSWSGTLEPGRTFEVKGVNGDIEVVPSSDGQIRVRVEKTSRRSDPDEVRIELVEWDGGLTMCAVYPSVSRRANECRPGERARLSAENSDVDVNFFVEVPGGVHLLGLTANGDVSAMGIESDAVLVSVNGDVDVATTGAASVETVNGDINAVLGAVRGALNFNTVNGDIALELPEAADAVISGQTVNGDVRSALAGLTLRRGPGPKAITGTLGQGGSNISLQSVNGEISIGN